MYLYKGLGVSPLGFDIDRSVECSGERDRQNDRRFEYHSRFGLGLLLQERDKG